MSALLRPGDIYALTQPVVRLADGQTVGYEVLARSHTFSDVPPDVWLHEAERAGCRTDVELACVQAALALGEPPNGARLFLNASAGLLLDARVDAILEALPEHVLEVTEHEQISDYATLAERLRVLASRGSLLAVDDVGAGYANMAHVLRLSPQFLKIDRSIVTGLHRDRDRRALIAALVAFAVACGAQTIAEGVEEVAELQALHELGVDLAQGFLLARPGHGWPVATHTGLEESDEQELAVLPLASRIERAGDLQTLADLVTNWLYEEHRLMPSFYVERAGVLRCLSRRGQWIVHDGLAPGIGITGTAYADDREVWVPDVRQDPRYRPAIPGVHSELTLPVHAGGAAIGVLNVESFSEMGPTAREHTRQAARLIEGRLERLGMRSAGGGPLRELSRTAPGVLGATNRAELAIRAVEAAIAVSELTSAALWWSEPASAEGAHAPNAHRATLGSSAGPAAAVLGGLDTLALDRLFTFAGGVTSCHTGGGSRDLSAGFLGPAVEAAVRAMLVVPLRANGETIGLLVVTSESSRDIGSASVEATELLGLYAAAAIAGCSGE